ncbi:MAG: sigma-70 family RNA polymerase sigma factor [Bacteroidales bacterium]|nr:sigma-70 family RNA polymerase sigma factor [Bacteroidales bacterium]
MKGKLQTDKELISRYLNGDHSSLEILIQRHQHRIFGYILMMVKNKELADDLFQDTFIKVINTLKGGTYNEEGKFLQWVMRIAHNLIIDYFRKSSRIPVFETSREDFDIFETLNISDSSIEDKLIKEQIHKDLRRLIELLPEEQKEVLYMRHYARMSFKDIADVTGVSINTALGRMRYALINLRKIIEEKNIVLSY